MRLTKNFSLDELTASGTAARLGIDNTPNDFQLQNLRRLAELLQQVRDHFQTPIFINSGFRCKALNDAVGSRDTSQHLKACAADIRISGVSPKEGVQRIIDAKIPYDQIICEYDSWIHISVSNDPSDPPRQNALTIDKKGVRVFA
jgi:zinc D-Ala-D-Ala carboxypeptidase